MEKVSQVPDDCAESMAIAHRIYVPFSSFSCSMSLGQATCCIKALFVLLQTDLACRIFLHAYGSRTVDADLVIT